MLGESLHGVARERALAEAKRMRDERAEYARVHRMVAHERFAAGEVWRVDIDRGYVGFSAVDGWHYDISTDTYYSPERVKMGIFQGMTGTCMGISGPEMVKKWEEKFGDNALAADKAEKAASLKSLMDAVPPGLTGLTLQNIDWAEYGKLVNEQCFSGTVAPSMPQWSDKVVLPSGTVATRVEKAFDPAHESGVAERTVIYGYHQFGNATETVVDMPRKSKPEPVPFHVIDDTSPLPAAALVEKWFAHIKLETENAARVSYPGAWPPPRVATTGIKFV